MKARTWNFHLKDYEALMEKVINFKSDIQIAGLPKFVIEVKFKLHLNVTTN